MQIHFEGETYQFDFDKIDVAQARYIKRQTDLSIRKILDGLKEIDPDCFVAIYWLMKTQSGQVADMGKVNFELMPFAEALGDAVKRDKEESPTEPAKPEN